MRPRAAVETHGQAVLLLQGPYYVFSVALCWITGEREADPLASRLNRNSMLNTTNQEMI